MQSPYGNSSSNHDVNDNINSLERGKHANDCYDKFNDPLYAQKFTKLPQSNNYIVNFASTICNYYERGGDKCPLYVPNNFKLQTPTDNMHWFTPNCCDSFIYKMLMHRKKVRFRCYLIYAS